MRGSSVIPPHLNVVDNGTIDFHFHSVRFRCDVSVDGDDPEPLRNSSAVSLENSGRLQ
jgi:hypothetical protein